MPGGKPVWDEPDDAQASPGDKTTTFGQGAPLVATAWGVFVWKEFKGVPAIKTPLIALFSFYIAGLVLLTAAGAK